MKKLICLLTACLLSSCAIGAGENSKITNVGSNFFPKVSGINLEGKKRDLPQAFDKKLNIVVVAFKREQQEEVNSWVAVADEIIKKNSSVAFFEVPLIYELNSFSRSFVNNGMRRGVTDAKSRQRTITVYTDRDKFFKITNTQEEKIYVFLINKNGKILWRAEGAADRKKSKLLQVKVKNLLQLRA